MRGCEGSSALNQPAKDEETMPHKNCPGVNKVLAVDRGSVVLQPAGGAHGRTGTSEKLRAKTLLALSDLWPTRVRCLPLDNLVRVVPHHVVNLPETLAGRPVLLFGHLQDSTQHSLDGTNRR